MRGTNSGSTVLLPMVTNCGTVEICNGDALGGVSSVVSTVAVTPAGSVTKSWNSECVRVAGVAVGHRHRRGRAGAQMGASCDVHPDSGAGGRLYGKAVGLGHTGSVRLGDNDVVAAQRRSVKREGAGDLRAVRAHRRLGCSDRGVAGDQRTRRSLLKAARERDGVVALVAAHQRAAVAADGPAAEDGKKPVALTAEGKQSIIELRLNRIAAQRKV